MSTWAAENDTWSCVEPRNAATTNSLSSCGPSVSSATDALAGTLLLVCEVEGGARKGGQSSGNFTSRPTTAVDRVNEHSATRKLPNISQPALTAHCPALMRCIVNGQQQMLCDCRRPKRGRTKGNSHNNLLLLLAYQLSTATFHYSALLQCTTRSVRLPPHRSIPHLSTPLLSPHSTHSVAGHTHAAPAPPLPPLSRLLHQRPTQPLAVVSCGQQHHTAPHRTQPIIHSRALSTIERVQLSPPLPLHCRRHSTLILRPLHPLPAPRMTASSRTFSHFVADALTSASIESELHQAVCSWCGCGWECGECRLLRAANKRASEQISAE